MNSSEYCHCGAPYHSATGHRFGADTVLCGRCAKDFLRWYKGRMGMMGARLKNKKTGERYSESFQDAAARSIIGDE